MLFYKFFRIAILFLKIGQTSTKNLETDISSVRLLFLSVQTFLCFSYRLVVSFPKQQTKTPPRKTLGSLPAETLVPPKSTPAPQNMLENVPKTKQRKTPIFPLLIASPAESPRVKSPAPIFDTRTYAPAPLRIPSPQRLRKSDKLLSLRKLQIGG